MTAIAGDVGDPVHRRELAASAAELGRLDLLVNNASELGPSPLPGLDRFPLDELSRVYEVNVVAPLGLIQLTLPLLAASGGAVVNVTSDAAVEGYEGWGGYGSSKAALEQLSRILAAEQPAIGVYWFDPGDMRTRHAPGRLPRRGHLRPARARDGRAGAGAAAGRAPAERPLPGRRHPHRRQMTGRTPNAARARSRRR